MENVFKFKYNVKLDKVDIAKERKVDMVLKFFENHKFISFIFISFIITSGINLYLIYSFLKILENI